MEQENMAYRVKEIFYTLQGEGAQARASGGVLPLIFRDATSGLGRPEDRAIGRKCRFCDTDFRSARTPGFSPRPRNWRQTIAATLSCASDSPSLLAGASPYIVFTGGDTRLAAHPRAYSDRLHCPRVSSLGRGEATARVPLPERAGLDHGQPQGFQPAGHGLPATS